MNRTEDIRRQLLLRATSGKATSLLVFAHPDDETIAVGGRLHRLGSGSLLTVTDGAPRNGYDSEAYGFRSISDYRAARRAELESAVRMAGLPAAFHQCFGIPDQEASLNLPFLIRQLTSILRTQRPEAVFTHPYEGGHPDHDACAFAVSRAVELLKRQEGQAPSVIEGPFYHAGRNGMETGCFPGEQRDATELSYTLSDDERSRKQALLACFETQQETLRYFEVGMERFRIAPEYDFGHPPHEGSVFYDAFPWGMTSQHFCELTNAAESVIEEEWACV